MLHLQPTHHCPALDSLLHSAARSTVIITPIDGELADISSVICGNPVRVEGLTASGPPVRYGSRRFPVHPGAGPFLLGMCD